MLPNGQEIDKSNALAVKVADVAGLLNLPKPMDWTNPLVTPDARYPYAFSLCGWAAEARSGLLQGLNTMFIIQLAAENVQGKDGNANHKAHRARARPSSLQEQSSGGAPTASFVAWTWSHSNAPASHT